MNNDFYYKFILPDKPLADFVENIGMFHNQSDRAKEVVLMPDGRVDLFFMQSESAPFQVTLIGLETVPEERIIPPHTLAYKVSFKPLGVEYILQTSIADILNSAKNLPKNFWNINTDDLKDFEAFHQKTVLKLNELLPSEIDERKRKLFELIYASNGEIKVEALSEKIIWSSRQINRYFNKQFGLSLNAFCKILRFKASLQHIAKGKLFPELNFTDQTHFIKEIRKFSGVVPSELLKNKDDRFILLSVLKQQ
ncbi:helix-turn-helix domain-containing protein [Flavobacterium sp. CF136]|uniref:helix-turn-helix domain-containing protein n=1 Tax=Flavobacterium sp. (strain CF136) TaxID=1144313 RepID=UPI00027196B9|nr:helix-turn-helix domain-containing protein [Flavobacterium sp. CF136]EJL62832.1 DNA-binding domain-containing protein, AraC-type [Flavobacterium sp. CF136]